MKTNDSDVVVVKKPRDGEKKENRGNSIERSRGGEGRRR